MWAPTTVREERRYHTPLRPLPLHGHRARIGQRQTNLTHATPHVTMTAGYWLEQMLPFVRPGGYGYGTDAADDALTGLKARADKLGTGEIIVRNLGDENRGLPADGSIDAISMRMSFHYEPKPIPALAAYYRALKKGGKLIIMEHPLCKAAEASKANPPTLAELKAKMSGEPMKMPGMKFMMSPLATFGHSMTFESLQPVFVDAGFELVEHGPWTGYEFNSCSWYAVFQKPVPQR